MKQSFFPADILLPDFDKVDGTKWSVVACDQYTSEPEYWSEVEKTVGDAPSTLKITLPEVYLAETEQRVPKINAEMEKYLKDVLISNDKSMIYVERTQRNGKARRGIVGMIDLEDYDFTRGSTSLIRATEGTVLSRIPPRVKIRKDAPIELPHVLMLIDDPDKSVIEPLDSIKTSFKKAYDFDLVMDSGHVSGYFVSEAEQRRILDAIGALATPESMKKKYGGDYAPLLFAVGDGNHSLATAKTCYEELKAAIGEEKAKNSPARYALVEIENLHDDTLEFEPIYRVVFGADVKTLREDLIKYAASLSGDGKTQSMTIVTANGDEEFTFENPAAQLTVGTLQNFLDYFVAEHPEAEIDYIHGEDSLRKLSTKDGSIGFLFDGMTKDQLFKTVICDGALPRKTFSMGHAHDKRFYLECRKVK
ncbi:MAG: DUF1015 domain-containing protein [Ruminococcaceae bacterium]|nr:DUF1015 domain-containing protein [Oscillospiraceae bacterium]